MVGGNRGRETARRKIRVKSGRKKKGELTGR